MKLIVILVLALVIGLPIAAGQILPWWGTLLVLVAEMVAILTAGPRLIALGVKRYLMAMFQRKSAVLRGAQVIVRGVELVPDPTPAEKRGEDAGPVRHVKVDFTITPKSGQSEMVLYDPLELMLVRYDAVASANEDPTADDSVAMATQVRLVDEQGQESECDKLSGTQRLRIVFGVSPKLAGRAKFRYYFEQFGDLMLP